MIAAALAASPAREMALVTPTPLGSYDGILEARVVYT
jgi:hypothetical protein